MLILSVVAIVLSMREDTRRRNAFVEEAGKLGPTPLRVETLPDGSGQVYAQASKQVHKPGSLHFPSVEPMVHGVIDGWETVMWSVAYNSQELSTPGTDCVLELPSRHSANLQDDCPSSGSMQSKNRRESRYGYIARPCDWKIQGTGWERVVCTKRRSLGAFWGTGSAHSREPSWSVANYRRNGELDQDQQAHKFWNQAPWLSVVILRAPA